MLFKRAGAHDGLIAPLEERYDAPDADAGADPGAVGGGSPPPAAEDGDAEQSGDEGDGAGLEASDREEALEDLLVDEDDADTDTQTGQQRSIEDRLKAVAKKNRKLRRQLAKVLPKLQRVKDLDLDDLITRARRADELSQLIERNPRLRRVLFSSGDAEEENRSARQRDPDEEETLFDEGALPFDPNESPTNRYFANLAKRNTEMERTVKQLTARIDELHGRDTARTEGEIKREWKTAIDAAADKVTDKGVRTVFKDAVTAAYQLARHKYTAQQIISHYLKELGVDQQDASRANAAAAHANRGGGKPATADLAGRQRIAEHNRNLPRTGAPTGGQPTTARKTSETVAEVSRRIRQLSQPPR